MRAHTFNKRDKDISTLSQMFELFTLQTQKLRHSHDVLKKQIEDVNAALEAKNIVLQNKISELHETNWEESLRFSIGARKG